MDTPLIIWQCIAFYMMIMIYVFMHTLSMYLLVNIDMNIYVIIKSHTIFALKIIHCSLTIYIGITGSNKHATVQIHDTRIIKKPM